MTDRPRRVAVAGVSGSGKSTFARRVAAVLGVPYVEIDALYHGPGWVPRETFLEDVSAFIAEPGWVTEWQYPSARERIAARAEMIIWLDYPTALTMTRLVRRTAVRSLRRIELWNGNVEPPLRTFFADPEHIVKWGWSTRNAWRGGRMDRVAAEHPGLRVVRLRRPRDAERWLVALAHEVSSGPESSR